MGCKERAQGPKLDPFQCLSINKDKQFLTLNRYLTLTWGMGV